MITHYIGRYKYSVYAFDIESHNDEESISKRETSIWLGSFINDESKVDDENSYIYTIEEFLEKLKALVNPKRKTNKEKKPIRNICIYVYNLSFEWSFILPVLLKQGYTFKEEIEKEDEYVFNTISTRSVSSVWQINLKMNKKAGKILFRDLSKIYGGGLAKVAKSFHLETQKGSINYRLNRLHNYKVTQAEKEYCFKDTRILIEILMKIDDKDFWQSSSMATYSTKKMINLGYKKYLKPYTQFRKEYPELDQEQTDFLRKGVEGGLCFVNPLFQFKEIDEVIGHIDAHQMHPTQGFREFFPCGNGEYFKGKPTHLGIYIHACRIRISYTGVKLHSIIKLIGLPMISDYELVVWDFEIPTMYKCYNDLEIKYIDGYRYHYKKLPWRYYYADNYKLRLKAKQEDDKFNILQYKLLNNASYGKLLEKPHNEVFENTIDKDGIITSLIHDKDNIKVGAKYTYIPVGSAIPAYSRVCLIELALKIGYKNVYYVDTDSIFFRKTPETWRIWENEVDHSDFLGGWALEEVLDKAQFTAPKRYKTEDSEGHVNVKMAGINFNALKDKLQDIDNHSSIIQEDEREIEFDYNEINIVSDKWKVQRAFRCKGGTIIDLQLKEIGIQKKYKEIAKANIIDYNEEGTE